MRKSKHTGDTAQQDDDAEQGTISKTARKHAAEHLQALGQQLATLSSTQLQRLALAAPLLKAIQDYQRFPSREAKRRQLQYVGRIMRDLLPDEDIRSIEAQLDDLRGLSAQAQQQFQLVEHWRHELLTDNNAVTRFISAYPQTERQQLRQLVKNARRHAADADPQQKSTARTLFRFLREAITQTDIAQGDAAPAQKEQP